MGSEGYLTVLFVILSAMELAFVAIQWSLVFSGRINPCRKANHQYRYSNRPTNC
jgi:hypothetical protein